MVSDQARNHIGDTYWKDTNALQEGDELSLDKGVLVEVAEPVGITQTDLAPLLAKKPKEPPKHPTPPATLRPFHRPTPVAPTNAARAGSQLRHKSLNTLLGTPKGPVGKAVPTRSPFEARKEREQENNIVEERAPKRQKVTQRPPAWRASSPVQEEQPSPIKPTPFARPSKVISISSESDRASHVSPDVTLPNTPAKVVHSIPLSLVSPSIILPGILPEPPPIETPKMPREKVRLPKKNPVETPKRPAPTSSPPVSASNRITNVDFAVQPVEEPRKAPSPPAPVRDPRAKSLRLSTGIKRATLLCQSIPRPASRAGREPKSSGTRPIATKTPRVLSKETSPIIPDNVNGLVSRTSPSSKEKRKAPRAEPRITSKGSRIPPPSLLQEEDAFDDPEVAYGIMDQQLLIRSSPSDEPRGRAVEPVECGVTTPITKAKKSALKNKAPDVSGPCNASPSMQPVLRPPGLQTRETSPTHTDDSGTHSRPTSASSNKVALSTGGFRKKQKRVSKKSTLTTAAPPVVGTERRTETVPLPPHPLVSGKKGPLMSTSELASLLSKQSKRSRVSDTIENDGQTTGKSPARKIRRVRSENDAPIPSIAEDWEKRNLPKTSSNLPEAEEMPPPAPEPMKKVSALAALVKRTDPRKKLQRTHSLNVDTNIPPVDVPELPSPVPDTDVGPWSTEAFDLFDWRPPNSQEA
ncbi:hypothetical protein BDU57DRAFT_513826, partial [Ampelomyces quisqualis]